ncbi:MAG TPA: RidA family protein [Blastocatellia bacterium]|nr:RidA family protein [Blastocatellia bacterium]
MTKEHLNPATLFPSVQLGFSQLVTARGGHTVYISGQTAWDSEKRIVGGMDLGEQTRQALRNIRTAVETAGGTLADVVSIRIYVVNYRRADARVIGEAIREFFPADKPPASTLIGVASLAVEEFMIEIEAIAVVDARE